MSEINSSITYFQKPGKSNTERVLELSKLKAKELGLSTVIVASTTGYTAKLAVDFFTDMKVVIVAHEEGFKGPDSQEFDKDTQRYVESKGANVLIAQHAFSGVSRAVFDKLGGRESEDLIKNVLRLFGQGMKVVFEIALMAADAGLVSCLQPAIVIGGTSRGADLGVVLYPANSRRFFDLKIVEVFCMPSPHHPKLKG